MSLFHRLPHKIFKQHPLVRWCLS